jgi:invasion protein IalB
MGAYLLRRAAALLPARTCFVLAMAVFSMTMASAQVVTKQKFGDWELRCEPQAAAEGSGAAAEQCYLYQNIADENSDRLNLIVSILRIQDPKKPDSKKLILRVLAPLGVLLPRGLGLKLDNADIGSTGFVRCWSNACIAEVDIDKSLQDQLIAAKEATFFFAVTEDEMRGLPVSLDKLGEGLAALE